MTLRLPVLLALLLSGCGAGNVPNPLPAPGAPAIGPAGAATTPTPQPSISGRIAFAAGHDLWVLSGDSVQRLTHSGSAQNPAWSPDGSTLAFDQADKNSADLWLLTYPDGPAHALTSNASPIVDNNFWEMQPDWSADGKTLVYASDRGRLRSGTLDLAAWQMALGTRQRTQLTTANLYTGGIDYPSFRPDAPSPQLLYTSWTYLPNNPDAYGQLELADLHAGKVWALTPSGQSILQASWSPNGENVAFLRRIDGQDQIWTAPVPYLVGADTNILANASLLVEGTNAHPAWSPAGDAIAYIGLHDGSFDLAVQPLHSGLAGAPGRALTSGRHLDADSAISWTR